MIIGLLVFTVLYPVLSAFWFSGPTKATGLLALAAITIESARLLALIGRHCDWDLLAVSSHSPPRH